MGNERGRVRHAIASAAALAIALALPGCAGLSGLFRPEGGGGWSPERRSAELAERAEAAGYARSGGPGGSASKVATGRAGAAGSATATGATGATPDPAVTAPAAPSADGALDLETTLALASRGSRRLAEQREELAIARERVNEARGRLLPNVTGQARYTWSSDALTNQVELPSVVLLPGVAAPNVVLREKDATTANGTLLWPIDLSGEIRHALVAAQAGYRGEAARVWAVELDEHVRAIRAYYELLEAQHLREVAEQALATYREQLGVARSRYELGRLTKNDLLVVEVAVANAEQSLVQRALAIDRARWALNEVTGLDVDAPTRVRDVANEPEVPPADETLHLARESNPVILSLLEEQQRLEETATALTRGRLPRFHVGGALDYSTSEVPQPQRVESAFAGATWDLGTDLQREARIAQAKRAAEKNRLRVERELRGLEQAVRATREAAAERLAALEAARVSLGAAEENLRIRRQQFDAGRAQSDDVLAAQQILTRERATLASALYQAQTRRAELQQLMGLSLSELAAATR
jgi:outer membrane protein TolC